MSKAQEYFVVVIVVLVLFVFFLVVFHPGLPTVSPLTLNMQAMPKTSSSPYKSSR